MDKVCTKCGESKILDCFSLFSRNKQDGRSSWRKKCTNKKTDESHAKRGLEYKKLNQWKADLKRSYNITIDYYQELLDNQNYGCAICGLPETSLLRKKVKRLAVDHDHKTGKIRGLLCESHNKALGLFGDSIEYLEKAITYLRKNNE